MGGRSVSSEEDIVTLQLLRQEVGCPYHEELRSTACSVALVVLWMGLHQEKFPLLATTLQAAAGVSGPQKWALILPSSARVSLVTYTAVIAVRYPELDNVQNELICFGNYLLGEQATSGGFLPLFWDAPSAYMHAATDIGSAVDWLQSQVELSSDENGCLAVLHNRNKMVATFGNSEWVTQSDGAVQSKSVTSCAGMTAHFVLLAQTKVGFLSGGRSRHMIFFLIFFCCIAELAIKPCRSSRSKLRGEFGIPKHLQNRKQKHNQATNTPNPKHNTKQKEHGKCLECETRGEKRVKRPKRPNALICRTPGGSIRYPLSCSLGMTLISHSIVSIPASPSRFAI